MARSVSGWGFRVVTLVAVLVVFIPGARAQVNVQGQWSTSSYSMPINPIHTALLHNGKILVIAGSGNCPPTQSGCPSGPPFGAANGSGALLLDPATGSMTQFNQSWDMFCNAMIVLPDGRAFIAGGTQAYDPFLGQPKSAVFDPATNSFTDMQSMAHGRWYPTLTTLGDGRVMTFSGQDETGATNNAVEIYTVGSGWSAQFVANWTPPLYPHMHLLPNGKVFYSGSGTTSMLFDPASQAWTTMDSTIYSGSRTYGSSVLLPLTPGNSYDPQVIIMGGGNPATATTEVIDLGAANQVWQAGPSMSQPRIEMNAVMLPNGKVLALGGSINDEDTGTASLNADLFDPATRTFSSAGANTYARLYHSVALLLPDATVWVAGGNPQRGSYEPHVEIYQPAYLFNSNGTLATRPTISSVPASISWNGTFTVSTPDAANISSVVLVRPGAPTHSFDMDQRLVGLSFTSGAGTLSVTGPPNGNIAPAGYYMLFVLNSSGVPSVAKFIQLSTSGSAPAPTVSSVSPASGSASGGTALNISGTGFLSGATVTVGGVAATNVAVVNSTSITATAPAHSAGATSIVVTNSDGQTGTLNNGYTYVPANPAPTVTSITPNSGTSNGGTSVTIAGSGFLAGATVAIGGTAATNVVVVSTASISATTPAHSAGAVNVTVTNPDSQNGSLTNGFTYTAVNPAPTVASLTPTSGSSTGGTSVIIVGTGFLAGATVKLGGTAATNVVLANSATITATTPAHSAGAVSVVVTNTDGQNGTLVNGYSYVNPAPGVTSIAPSSGSISGGGNVTIAGTGFLAGASVKFGGTAATNVVVVNGSSITAVVPAHSAGPASVVITNSDGQSGTLTNGYTYTNPAPSVVSITPNAGSANGGTSTTIAGTGFLTGATVKFGATAATNVVVGSGTSITATTPAQTGATTNVTVTNSDGQSGALANGYTFTSGLGLVLPTGDPSSVTVNAGQTATYTLSVGGMGLSGTASFTCTSAPTPKGVNCSVPATVSFDSTVPATFSFPVTTTAPNAAALRPPGSPRSPWSWTLAMAMLGIVIVPTMKMRVPSRSKRKYLWLASLGLCLFLGSCGGGGSTGGGNGNTPPTNPNATAPGTYVLTVHATSGSVTGATSLTLIVR